MSSNTESEGCVLWLAIMLGASGCGLIWGAVGLGIFLLCVAIALLVLLIIVKALGL